ncbi:hypothetical protein B9H00_13530 [Kushneria marisflavi]|uniref:Uncharacterized protein n=2 Tax=Kushneria marisflavi TaxID=157779 RepID=A0A240USE9_9GAMM|nr:hypothetical protein B9H00_13530 [Kushneria marisflavi]
MTTAVIAWCGISLWIASRFGRTAQATKRPAGDEHALIIIGAARPRTRDNSANDDDYDAPTLRRIREWNAT